MKRSTKGLIGYPIGAGDGGLGLVKDSLIDDRDFVIRSLVAGTGRSLSSRQVMISPRHRLEPDLGKLRNHWLKLI